MNNKKRYLRIGFNFDDLRGMSLNDIGEIFSNDFDDSFYLIDVRDDISSGHTFFLVESETLKEVNEGQAIPVVFAELDCTETEDGPDYYCSVQDYSQHLESKSEPKMSRWEAYEDEISKDSIINHIKPLQEELNKFYDKIALDTTLYGSFTVKLSEDGIEHVPVSEPMPKEYETYYYELRNKMMESVNNSYYLIYNPLTGQMEEYDEKSPSYISNYGYSGDTQDSVAFKEKYGTEPHEHVYKSYQGLVEQYDFCDVSGCKAKREYTGNGTS